MENRIITTEVPYSRVLPVIMIVLGLINVVLTVLIGELSIGTFIGAMVFFIGVSMLARPYIKVKGEEIEIAAGPLNARKYPLSTITTEIQEGRIHARVGDKWRTVAARWNASKPQWESLVEELRRNASERGPIPDAE